MRAHSVKRPQFSVRTFTSRRRNRTSQENAGHKLGGVSSMRMPLSFKKLVLLPRHVLMTLPATVHP